MKTFTNGQMTAWPDGGHQMRTCRKPAGTPVGQTATATPVLVPVIGQKQLHLQTVVIYRTY